MAYDNQIEIRKSSTMRKSFGASAAINLDDDNYLHNFRFYCKANNVLLDNGYVANGFLLAPLIIAGNEIAVAEYYTSGKIFYYRRFNFNTNKQDDKLIINLGAGNPIKYINILSDDLSLHTLNIDTFTGKVNFINYRLDGEDVLIMSSAENSLMIWNGEDSAYIVPDCPPISSMCMHFERLFATSAINPTRLWWSDDLDPRNWSVSIDEAGYIEIVDIYGNLNKVVSFLDYVYIFKTYGITRLSANAAQADFALSEIYSTHGKIYSDSIQVCGDRIMFLSTSGLYSFDGMQTIKLDLKIDKLLCSGNFDNITSSFFDNKYYFAFRNEFDDSNLYGCENTEHTNNMLLVYDLKTKTISVTRGIDVLSLESLLLDSQMELSCLYFENNMLRLSKISNQTSFQVEKDIEYFKSDFSYPDKLKLIKNLYINAGHDFTLILKTENRQVVKEISATSGGNIIPIYLACKWFGFEIRTSGDILIHNMSIDYEVI